MSPHSQPQTDSPPGSDNQNGSDPRYPNLTGISNHVLYLRGNGHSDDLLAWGNEHSITLAGNHTDFEKLQTFLDEKQDWVFGYLGYELKNAVEKLVSAHPLSINFPPGYFLRSAKCVGARKRWRVETNQGEGSATPLLHSRDFWARTSSGAVYFERGIYSLHQQNIRPHPSWRRL